MDKTETAPILRRNNRAQNKLIFSNRLIRIRACTNCMRAKGAREIIIVTARTREN